MIIRIHGTGADGTKNTGSSSNLVEYLEKENRDVNVLQSEGFFSHDNDHITPDIVERTIDANKGRLAKDETKFYMLTVNPSERELNHISNDKGALRSYVRDLMDEYAKSMNRTYGDGRAMEGKDLVYYAKIENQRTYKFEEKKYRDTIIANKKVQVEIARNLSDPVKVAELKKHYIKDENGNPILEGQVKPGNNRHVHIIVSRYDKEQKFKLSPLANQRKGKGILNGKEHNKGFDRDQFVQKGEQLFDRKFNYKRKREESYNYYKTAKLGLLGVRNPQALAKVLVKKALIESIKDKTLQKSLNMATTNPKHIPKMTVAKLERQAVKAVLNALDKGAYTNPVTFALSTAKKAITIGAKALSKSVNI